jgi:hypothetical protein
MELRCIEKIIIEKQILKVFGKDKKSCFIFFREPDMDPQKQYNVFLCRTVDDSNNSRYNPKYEVRKR